LFKKEAKELKEFKVKLGGSDTEKVVLPSYGDDDRDETLLTLVKEFNMMIEDGDLLKNEESGLEEHRNGFTNLKRKNKLKAIKETFRNFRSCLKGDPRDKWITLTDDLPVITQNNYEVDNTFGVEAFYLQQTALVSKSLDEDAVEMTNEYLQYTKKPRSQKIENYIRRVKNVNNYIPLMKQGAQKLTERELIKTVIVKKIPNKWLQDLKRANNHNLATLEELQSVLKPIEEADESDQQENSRQKKKPRFERPSN